MEFPAGLVFLVTLLKVADASAGGAMEEAFFVRHAICGGAVGRWRDDEVEEIGLWQLLSTPSRGECLG